MEKILLVEDEKETAVMVARFLERKGFHVDVAYTLPQGLDAFSPEHKIVLLDIMLEGETCFPLLKKIKDERPQTGVIVVSAHDDEENIREAKRLGADDFIAKPFVSEHLEGMLLSKIHSLSKEVM